MQRWTRPSRLALSGLMSGFLLLSLTACASNTLVLSPPAEYLQPCLVPDLIGDTNGALAQWSKDTKQSLVRCNEDKTAIKEWVSKAQKKVR